MLHLTLLALLLSGILAAPAGNKQDLSCSKRFIVFGDSLTDNGTGIWEQSNHILPVSPPYYQHSFSNGPGWVALLAKKEKLEVHNYAQGGATIDNDVITGFVYPDPLVIARSIKDQVATYLSTDTPRKTDVFCLYAGANEALMSPNMDFTGTQAVELLNEQVGTLYKKGGRKILLVTLPDISMSPGVKLQPAMYQDYAAKYSTDYRTSIFNSPVNGRS